MDTQELEVGIIKTREDVRRFDKLLEKEHCLGPRKPSGDAMRMVVTRNGEWVALLLWTSAARQLKPRDTWIGWDAAKRLPRLKLVVQNSRFLVPGAGASDIQSIRRHAQGMRQDHMALVGFPPQQAEELPRQPVVQRLPNAAQ